MKQWGFLRSAAVAGFTMAFVWATYEFIRAPSGAAVLWLAAGIWFGAMALQTATEREP